MKLRVLYEQLKEFRLEISDLTIRYNEANTSLNKQKEE